MKRTSTTPSSTHPLDVLLVAVPETAGSALYGMLDVKAGFEAYPFLRRNVRTDIRPVELYFRPPGTTGSADVLFERQTFRSLAGPGSETYNKAWETIYGGYFQDRWWPTTNISIKAGLRIDSNRIYTQDREKVLAALKRVLEGT